MKKKKVTFLISEDSYEKLRKLAFVSRKPQATLVEEAFSLLFNTPGK